MIEHVVTPFHPVSSHPVMELRPGDMVAFLRERWQIGIVLVVFQPGGELANEFDYPDGCCHVLFDDGTKMEFPDCLDDKLVFLERSPWYDVAEWRACDKMKDIDEVRRHFALRQTLPSSGPSSQKCG